MHCSLTFDLLKQPEANIAENLEKDEWITLRQNIIAIILATDLQKHFDKLAEFRQILNSEEGFNMSNDKHKLIAIEICLKCADIGHSAKKLSIHKIWTSQITKEFFRQGDHEREKCLPVSPLCDRDTVNIAQSQRGFLSVLTLPLFQTWEEFIEQEDASDASDTAPHKILTRTIQLNIEFWEREIEEQTFYLDDAPPLSMFQRKLIRAQTTQISPDGNTRYRRYRRQSSRTLPKHNVDMDQQETDTQGDEV